MAAEHALTGKSKTIEALILALAMAVVVGSALGFEHIGGFIPCALCLEQRTPYYIGVPVMLAAAAASMFRAPVVVTRLLFAAGGLLMLYGAGLGVYHSGVEWGWWPGPADCGGAAGLTTDASNLLADINAKTPPACDEAAGRFLGLSFAGWNVITSVVLATGCLRGAWSVVK
ncbi:disulfide bond formation protein B [Hoeflea prorocentri]|uniref:Disulfide bond formation protein B n=1 Tax=Hoeflea prorocentri TaxID=1922333 RepID=A0A9X3UR31_9HYPH|nr:disulfide bond formation protein B [Hoeflea prorocentri]MCY6383661.1 disulfide bond formation protein B [Hoeflea prorocentri]MDA5401461.1 disulfide bond formation protein B [Hoeflea prorocentri]